MPGTILENLSGRKLSVLVTILLLSQLTCFLVGLICPSPGSSQQILATVCLDHTPKNKPQLFSRNCSSKIDLLHMNLSSNIKAEDLVSSWTLPTKQNPIITFYPGFRSRNAERRSWLFTLATESCGGASNWHGLQERTKAGKFNDGIDFRCTFSLQWQNRPNKRWLDTI